MEYVLTTNVLRKQYGRFKALNGLTMNVPKGAIYGFVGKNDLALPLHWQATRIFLFWMNQSMD